MPVLSRMLPAALFAVLLALILAGCGSTGLAPGLTARMDAPGARLDTEVAIGLINHLRLSLGAPALDRDTGLETMAQQAANAYAASNQPPNKPDGAGVLLTSAGYSIFAETFSGWRGSQANTEVLADPDLRRAGLAVSVNDTSESGTYWVLLLAP